MHKPMRILLVEDSPEDALIIQENLNNMHVDADVTHVRSMADAEAALTSVTTADTCPCDHYDLVLLDLHLPDGQGLACLRHLRSLCTDVSLVVFTGQVDEAVPEYFKAGANDFLQKGVSQRQVEAVIYRSGMSTDERRVKRKKWGTINKKLSALEKLVIAAGELQSA